MRYLVPTLCVLSIALPHLHAEEPAANPQSEPRETVRFDGQTLELAFSGEDPGATIKEFVPPGETLTGWTRLAAIRQFDDFDDPSEYGIATVEELKKKYPQAPSSLLENPKTGTVVLDFVVWPEDASFAEFNVFRYEKRSGGGLISQQFAVRAYGDDTEPFLKDLQPLRARLVEEMATDGLQFESDDNASTPDANPAAESAVP